MTMARSRKRKAPKRNAPRARKRRRNPSSGAATEAARLIAKYGHAEALRVAESIAHQRGVPQPSYTHWRNVIDAIKARGPRGTNAPSLAKVHAGLESAYLAAVSHSDKTSQRLARSIRGPWAKVEKLLKRKPRARRNPSDKANKVQRMLAYTVKRGGRAVGTVVARTARQAAVEAKAAGLQLGREVKAEFCRNPPHRAVLSGQALELAYKHSDNGRAYAHKFTRGVRVRVSKDHKRVTLSRPDGKVLAAQYIVPESETR